MQDIVIGGSLRGIAVTPAAQFEYVADKERNQIAVVDLREGEPTFRSVVANIDVGIDPVDVAVAPNGLRVITITQGDGAQASRLVINNIGSGPQILSVYPPAAPPGAVVTINGTELGFFGDIIDVSFNGVLSSTSAFQTTKLIVTVPQGATTGPLTVDLIEAEGDGTVFTSNAIAFTVLGPSGNGNGREAARLDLQDVNGLWQSIAVSRAETVPTGAARTATSTRSSSTPPVLTITATAARFRSEVDLVTDLAITPDGKTLYATATGSSGIGVLDVDPGSPGFMKARPAVDFGSFSTGAGFIVRASPDNRVLLSFDNQENVNIIDATGHQFGDTAKVLDQTVLSSEAGISDIVFHPGSDYAIILWRDAGTFYFINTNRDYESFGFVEYSELVNDDEVLMSAAFSSDGNSLYLYSASASFGSTVTLWEYDMSSVFSPAFVQAVTVSNPSNFTNAQNLRLKPQGDRLVLDTRDVAFRLFNTGTFVETPAQFGDNVTVSYLDFAFTPDGSRMYVASPALSQGVVYDSHRAIHLEDLRRQSGGCHQ